MIRFLLIFYLLKVAKKVHYPRHDSNKTVYMYSFEKGSPMYTGETVRTYKKGQIVESMIRVSDREINKQYPILKSLNRNETSLG